MEGTALSGRALGMIETRGLVPVIEAADVAVKTADVRLTELQTVGAGIVCVLMTGDVAAVQAAVDAGSRAAARLGNVRSASVLARTAQGLEKVVTACRPKHKGGCCKQAETQTCAYVLKPEKEKEEPLPEPQVLAEMTVYQLKGLARKIKDFPLTGTQLKKSTKKTLLGAFEQIKK